MKPYYEEPGITIYHGDCRDILPSLPKVDLVLTDPPYGKLILPTDQSHQAKALEYAPYHGEGTFDIQPCLKLLDENHPKWKGGRYIDRDGYIRVYQPDHLWPRRGGYILEHVFLMETLLQRRLEKSECVHHKDHNRKNNLPENLEVVVRGDHSRYHRKLDAHKFERDAKGRYVDLPR